MESKEGNIPNPVFFNFLPAGHRNRLNLITAFQQVILHVKETMFSSWELWVKICNQPEGILSDISQFFVTHGLFALDQFLDHPFHLDPTFYERGLIDFDIYKRR